MTLLVAADREARVPEVIRQRILMPVVLLTDVLHYGIGWDRIGDSTNRLSIA